VCKHCSVMSGVCFLVVVSVVVGMSMSVCIVVFLTYHGTLVAVLRIRFCNVCIFVMCVLAAEFHNAALYC
jgi:hypothetical protein